jgi:hypothetical protein
MNDYSVFPGALSSYKRLETAAFPQQRQTAGAHMMDCHENN